jgi:hypothetical protein
MWNCSPLIVVYYFFFTATKLTDSDGYVIHMEYSPIIGGYIMVMSTGRAMFVIPPSSRVESNVSYGVVQ